MIPVPQPPYLTFHKSIKREKLDAQISAAIQWRSDTGWPGKERDLTLAARLYGEFRGPTEPEEAYVSWHANLAQALFDKLSEIYPPTEVEHRYLLCLLIIQGASRGLGFNA